MIKELAIVFAAGNFSCPWNLHPSEQTFFEKLSEETGAKHAWASCFSFSKFKYWNTDTNVVKEIDYDPGSAKFHEQDLSAAIDDLAAFNEKRRSLMVGHSWGAWFLIKASESVSSNQLVTIDAISRLTCRFKGKWHGCREFPEDVDDRKASSNVGTWYNFYQPIDLLLSSGASLFAYNHEVYGERHYSIKYSDPVWSKISEFAKKRHCPQDHLQEFGSAHTVCQ